MTVSLYWHIIVVLAMLATHAATFVIFQRRIKALKNVLQAKRALLGEPQALMDKTQFLCAGDSLTIDAISTIIEIRSAHTTELDVRVLNR